MRQEYFTHNNIRYDSGSIIILSRFDYLSRRVCNTKATFLYYDTETNEYCVDVYGKQERYSTTRFYEDFVGPYQHQVQTSNQNDACKQYTFADELNIDGLIIAWIWYVFIMAIGVIFYDRISIWIVASIIFFNYRNKKLKEAGYK